MPLVWVCPARVQQQCVCVCVTLFHGHHFTNGSRSYSSSGLPRCMACLCPHRASPHSSPAGHWDHSYTPRSNQQGRSESAPGCERPAAPGTLRPLPVCNLRTHIQSEGCRPQDAEVQQRLLLPGTHRYGWQLTSSRQPFLFTWHKWLLGQGLGLHGWMTSSTMLLLRELGAVGHGTE